MKRRCRVQRYAVLEEYGEEQTFECERKHRHRGKHRYSWWQGDEHGRFKVRVTWTSG